MRASRLRRGSAPIPFRTAFGHAAKVRDRAENVLVQVEDAEGNIGVGEGCPRDYVTGETVAGALRFLDEHAASLLTIGDVAELRAWIAGHAAVIDANPSAFCAAELALLDLFGRQQGRSIETLLGIEHPETPVAVSAVYGSGGALKFRAQAFLFARNGMRDAKLKLSGDAATNIARAKALARRGRVRLDANNLWANAAQAMGPLSALASHAWAIEEPIAPRDWNGMRQICQQTGLACILDESFLTLADLDAAPKDMGAVPNIRVSKLGGLLRSLDCLAHDAGDVIVGAQVGETSILARAGLAAARAAGPRLKGFEGAYAPLLLKQDVVAPSLGFGRGGVVRHAAPAAPGLGVTPNDCLQAAVRAAVSAGT